MPTRDQSQIPHIPARRGNYARFLFIVLLLLASESVWEARGLTRSWLTRTGLRQEQQSKPEPMQGRSGLPLPRALLGHWVCEASKTHMYFTPDLYISVYSGKFYVAPYTLEEINEQDRSVRMRIKSRHSRILNFSAEKDSFVDVAEVAGIKATAEQALHWKFVDESQKPTPEVIQSTQGDESVLEAVTIEDVPKIKDVPKPEFIIGDTRTKLFYRRGCPEYDKLPLRRRAYFKSKMDAQRAGYHAAQNCP
jgi:hypothetical protein